MNALLPAPRRVLCAVADIADGGATGFRPPPGGFTGLFAVRRGDMVRVYLNSCPHIGTPLDWAPDRFLSKDGQRIVCATHGAEFAPDTGICLRGPCQGDQLEAIAFTVEAGVITVAADAGL
jgi:nitrite reductase/ring-hydroxylating ferredoxin subunit